MLSIPAIGTLLSLILGIVALGRIKRLRQKGRGLAIAGIVISSLWIVLFVLVGVLANAGGGGTGATSSNSSGASGTATPTASASSPASVDPLALKVGDCFDSPPQLKIIVSITPIPCTTRHNSQVFAKFNMPGTNTSYPATATRKRLASQGCQSRMGGLDQAKLTNAMLVQYFYPQPTGWATGERGVVCLIVNPASNLTSSLMKTGASG